MTALRGFTYIIATILITCGILAIFITPYLFASILVAAIGFVTLLLAFKMDNVAGLGAGLQRLLVKSLFLAYFHQILVIAIGAVIGFFIGALIVLISGGSATTGSFFGFDVIKPVATAFSTVFSAIIADLLESRKK